MHECNKQEQWGTLNEKIRRYDEHLYEADRAGGFRDRFAILERNVRIVMIGSFICAFVGSLTGQTMPILGKILEKFIKFF